MLNDALVYGDYAIATAYTWIRLSRLRVFSTLRRHELHLVAERHAPWLAKRSLRSID